MSTWKRAALRRLGSIGEEWRGWSSGCVDCGREQARMGQGLGREGRGINEFLDGGDLFSV